MTSHSQQHLYDKNEVYRWILDYQQRPTEEIKTKLVLHYEDLVNSLARRFSRGQELFEDLAQVGMVGLLAALTRYDPSYGRSFESFAVPTIVGEIKRYIRDKTWSVHVPRRIKELGPRIKKAIEELTTQLERSPNVLEIADYLGATEEDVLETLEMGKSYQALSVDSTIEADQEGGTTTLLDLVGEQEAGYDQVNQRLVLDKIFSVLSEREKAIIHLTYFKGLSQKEAGTQLQISQMHVSRLQRRALQKLKETMKVESSELIQ
jgi:RNA polymerase sigma-B factor